MFFIVRQKVSIFTRVELNFIRFAFMNVSFGRKRDAILIKVSNLNVSKAKTKCVLQSVSNEWKVKTKCTLQEKYILTSLIVVRLKCPFIVMCIKKF